MNYDTRIAPENGQDLAAEPYNPLDEVDEDERRAGRRNWIIGAVVALLLVAVWFALHGTGPSADEAAAEASQAAAVSVIVPGRTTVAGTINATGTIDARRDMPVGSPGEGGQVAQVLVEAGQWVGQGQVLAVIDRSVQSQQQASLAAQIGVSQADARLAQANLDRALKLVEGGFVSKADIDRLTALRDAANARVRVANAQLGEMRARINRLNIVAPAAGLVLERNVEPGQVVSAGSGVLFRIAKGGEMELLARLGEADLAALSNGISAEVIPVGSSKSFTGQVWQIAPVIDQQTRQGTARIALSYTPELRPGGFASVVIRSGTVVAPLLPESAIHSDEKGSFVYIVGKDNKVERRPVKLGSITGQGIVIAEGLAGTERIVLRAGGFLNPGETVNPRLVK